MSQYIIQTRDLTKTYGEQKSVSNLNMHVRKGKIYGLLTEPFKEMRNEKINILG